MTVDRSFPSQSKKLLQKEMSAVGLNRDVFSKLPCWWEDAIEHPSGVFEVKGFVAKHFGLEIGPDGALRLRSMPHACFKTRSGLNVTDVATARAAATAIARIIAGVTENPFSADEAPLPSAMALRSEILEHRPWVSFSDLVKACWISGIPVIYVPSMPVSHKKMDGMVAYCEGRPVILLTKKQSHPAWMLFVLAHEMGHLALGHVDGRDGSALIDEKVDEGEAAINDPQELAANAYALELLTGGKKRLALMALQKAHDLALSAKNFGAQNQIDPGHVVLNAIRNTKVRGKAPWPLANSVLKYIDHEASVDEVCRETLLTNIDVDAVSDDSFEFLEHMGVLASGN